MRLNMLTRGVALSGALTLVRAQAAFASGGGESTPLHLSGTSAAHSASGSSSGILRTVIALIVVIAVIYGISRILRSVKGSGARATGSGLSQIATLPLAPGRSVALVKAGRDIVLVGVAEHGVTVIKTYTEAEALAGGIDIPIDTAPGYEAAESPFGRVMDQFRRLTVRS